MKKKLNIAMFAAAAVTALVFLITSSIWMNLFAHTNAKGIPLEEKFLEHANGRAIIGLLLSIMAVVGLAVAGYMWYDQKEFNLIALGLVVVSMAFLLIELFIVSYGDGGQNDWRDTVKDIKALNFPVQTWATNAANAWPVNLTFILLGGGTVLGTAVANVIIKA